MIELLGVGVPRREGGWLLHRVCAALEAGELTTVLSLDADERRALLDVITGRLFPDEGRVWVDRVPVMPAALGRVRRLCGDVDPSARLTPRRSLFWNALAPVAGPRALGRLLRLPCRGERDAVRVALERVGLRAWADEPVAALSTFNRQRLLVARALARRPRILVIRDPDSVLDHAEVGGLLALLRSLARHDHLAVVVSLVDSAAGHGSTDRMLRLHEGRLRFHGRPDGATAPRLDWQARAITR